jgi:hypothetical protein
MQDHDQTEKDMHGNKDPQAKPLGFMPVLDPLPEAGSKIHTQNCGQKNQSSQPQQNPGISDSSASQPVIDQQGVHPGQSVLESGPRGSQAAQNKPHNKTDKQPPGQLQRTEPLEDEHDIKYQCIPVILQIIYFKNFHLLFETKGESF